MIAILTKGIVGCIQDAKLVIFPEKDKLLKLAIRPIEHKIKTYGWNDQDNTEEIFIKIKKIIKNGR